MRINSLLDSEGGVVAHKKSFGMHIQAGTHRCERPPRLRRFGGFAPFLHGASTPPHEEGTFAFTVTLCAKPLRGVNRMRFAGNEFLRAGGFHFDGIADGEAESIEVGLKLGLFGSFAHDL